MDKASKAVRDSRTYKERSQPKERKKWGLLEKHKDYALRARSHNAKKKTLQQLRAKAAERNPDEFYFGMINRSGPSMLGKNRTGTVSGKKHGEGIIGQEAMRLYKTQDLGYVRGMRNVVGKEVKTLEEKLKLDMGAQGRARKTVYIEDTDQMAKLMQQNMQDDAATDDEESEDKVDEPVTQAREANREKILARHRLRLDNRLANATKRLEALSQAEQALDVQRAKMGKAPTVGGTNKDGKTFKIRQRKR